MIGPKHILSHSLDFYRINSDQTLECFDNFEKQAQLKDDISTSHNLFIIQISERNLGKNKQVRFNMDVVKCQFARLEPPTTISKQTKKLMSLNPKLEWVNPSFSILKRK